MAPYLVVGGIGVALLVFSLVVGELFDGLFDAFGWRPALRRLARRLPRHPRLRRRAGVRQHRQSHGVGHGAGLLAGVLVGAGAGWLSSAAEPRRRRLHRARRRAWPARRHRRQRRAREGYGEVSVVVAGHITKLNARAAEPLPAGTPVTITAVLSATSVQVARRG